MVMREKLIELLAYANELADEMCEHNCAVCRYDQCGHNCPDVRIAEVLIDNGVVVASFETTTNADLVEVVRCKDCKHWERWATTCGVADKGYCNCHEVDAMEQDDFCSYGERKGDDNA